MQIVVSCASAVVDIGVGMALAFAPVVRLDTANGVLLEFVHMQNEIGHGRFSLFIFSGDSGDSGDHQAMTRLFGGHHSNREW